MAYRSFVGITSIIKSPGCVAERREALRLIGRVDILDSLVDNVVLRLVYSGNRGKREGELAPMSKF
jgi:hypothetical protein